MLKDKHKDFDFLFQDNFFENKSIKIYKISLV